MYATDTLGATSASFVCSANGTCQGQTRATQQAFIALQTQINRVGVRYAITKVSTDGKLGPLTLRAMVNLAHALASALGSNLDPAIEEIIIEVDDKPTTTRDLALNAERIATALERDGAKAGTWSVLESIRDVAQQIVANGAAAPQVPPLDTRTPLDPYQTTAPESAPTRTPDWWAATVAATAAANQPAPPPPVAAKAGVPGWAIAAGVGTVAVVGGLIAALAGKGGGVSGTRRRRQLGCACGSR